MTAAIEELAAVGTDREPERLPRSPRRPAPGAWSRFLQERTPESARTTPRRWRDEEGL
jgi:hypothetical protein